MTSCFYEKFKVNNKNNSDLEADLLAAPVELRLSRLLF